MKNYLIYRNLTKNKFSIKSNRDGVVAHADRILLRNVVPVYSKSGQKRAKESNVRNVHAYLKGEVIFWEGDSFRNRDIECGVRTANIWNDTLRHAKKRAITYNPFRDKGFVYKDTGELVEDFGDCVVLIAQEGKNAIVEVCKQC